MKATTLARPLVGALAATAAVSSLLLVPGAVSATTAAPKSYTYFGGQTYGSIVGLGSLARSGKTAYVPMCTSTIGAKYTDSTAALTVPGLGSIGAVTNRMVSAGHHNGVSTTATSRTAGTTMLAGLIKVQALTATAREFKTKSGKYIPSGSASLVKATILGVPLPAVSTPNQKLSLPGLGFIVLNQVTTSNRNGNHTVKVTALRLHLNPDNTLGLPGGAVTIGHAMASVHDAVSHQAYGNAYGTTANVLGVVKSGKTASVGMGCGGTGGKTVGNSVAGVNIPSVLQVGGVRSTTRSATHGTRMVATTRSRIAAVNLLGGMIKAQVITARAQAVRNGTHLTRTSTGTSLIGLTIAGQSFAAPTQDMTQTIPGLATLYFNHQQNTHTGLQVYALKVVLLKDVGGLASGATIVLGAASAGVKP
jgi:hypothetical protein